MKVKNTYEENGYLITQYENGTIVKDLNITLSEENKKQIEIQNIEPPSILEQILLNQQYTNALLEMKGSELN